jgi:U3 small nucleolar RNA-associated protein 10
MTPYLSFFLSPFIESLQVSDDSDEEDSLGPARLCIVQTLTKSMNVDEGGSSSPPPSSRAYLLMRRLTFSQTPAFWRDDRLQQLMPVLVSLIPHASIGTVVDQDALLPSSSSSKGSNSSSRDIVSAGLVALCNVATDDTLLKRLNLDVLMHTRTEDDAPVRIFALQCARALWTAHGLKLIGERDYYSFFFQLADNMWIRPRLRIRDLHVYR